MKKKIAITIILLMLVTLVPVVSAQGNEYSITAEKALDHANAHMIQFIEIDNTNFGNWKGAFIDPKPLELYDINGQKLYYQFSVYKSNNVIGKIDVSADKTLGPSVQVLELNPKPFKAAEAMNKSIKIAKNKYPTGKIESTKMVVYSYPKIGAMTVVKDTTARDEYRIFVDAYTLDVVPDRPATETELGVWSMYEQKSKNGIDENLKEWQESDQLTKTIKQEATKMGIDISVPITEEKMNKLSSDAAITLTGSSKSLSVPLYGQENDHYCAPASAKMISKYYGVTRTQNSIYQMMGPTYGSGGTVYDIYQLNYYKPSTGLNKPNSVYITSGLTFSSAVSEINSNRPYVSISSGHSRVCRGYSVTNYGLQYLAINDPWPIGSGFQTVEGFGLESRRIYVRS